MTRIRVSVPPDKTPEEEAELVAMVASAYEEMHGPGGEVTVEIDRPEEVDVKGVADRAHASKRWST